MTIVLSHPPRALHPNSRPHPFAKAHAAKRYRRTAWLISLAGPRPGWKRVHVHTTFHFMRRANRDTDNLGAWMKSGYDGIADAGVVQNDNGMIHWPVETVCPAPRNEVHITIRPECYN